MIRETTRKRIVEAAASSLTERGIAGTTTKEVARRASLSEAAIYLHFSSKDDLLRAVARDKILQSASSSSVPTASDGRSVREVLIGFVSELIEEMRGHVPLLCAVSGDARLAAFLREEIASPARFQGMDRLDAYLRREQRGGRLGRGVSSLMLARMLYGAAFHHAYLLLLFGDDVRPRGRAFVTGLVDTALATAGDVPGRLDLV